MAFLEEHEQDCLHFLEDKCTRVHNFLDMYIQFYPPKKCGEYHRAFLHNKYGIELIFDRWGKDDWYAAMIHIAKDFWCGDIIHMTIGRIIKLAHRGMILFNTPYTNPNHLEVINIMKIRRSIKWN